MVHIINPVAYGLRHGAVARRKAEVHFLRIPARDVRSEERSHIFAQIRILAFYQRTVFFAQTSRYTITQPFRSSRSRNIMCLHETRFEKFIIQVGVFQIIRQSVVTDINMVAHRGIIRRILLISCIIFAPFADGDTVGKVRIIKSRILIGLQISVQRGLLGLVDRRLETEVIVIVQRKFIAFLGFLRCYQNHSRSGSCPVNGGRCRIF